MKPDPAGIPPKPASSPHSSRTPQPGVDDDVRETLAAYVTGALPQAAAEAFELRLLEDDQFAERVDQAEADLLDDYALAAPPGAGPEPASSGSAQQALGYEPWILTSAARREHVRLARLLRERTGQPLPAEATSAGTARLASRRWNTRRFWLAAAACMVLAAGLLLLRQLAPSGPSGPSRHTAPARQTAIAHRDQPPAVILLAAERLRGSGAAESKTFTIPPDAPVRLQVLLPHVPEHATYALSIRRAGEDRPIASFAGLSARQEAGLPYLEAPLAPGAIRSGNYVVSVVSAGGAVHLPVHVAAP